MQDIDLPDLLVFPDKYELAWRGTTDEDGAPYRKDKEERVPVYDFVDAQSALDGDHSTDAHCAMYAVEGQTCAPRIAKKAVREDVIDPVLRWVFVDVDAPDHKGDAPLENAPIGWIEQIIDAEDTIPELSHCLRWSSTGGYKYAWPLADDRQYGVQKGEDYLQQFLKYLKEGGLDVDMACKDWTRVMRLPRTVRDGQFQDYEVEGWDSLEPLDWEPPRKPQKQKKTTTTRTRRGKKASGTSALETRTREALQFVDPECDYAQWTAIGFALKTHFDDSTGFQIWKDWSERADDPADDLRGKWEQLAGEDIEEGVTLRTVFYHAREGGWSGQMDPEKAQDRIIDECGCIPDYFEDDALQAAAALRQARGAGWSIVVNVIKKRANIGCAPKFSDWQKAVIDKQKELEKAQKQAEAELKRAELEAQDDRVITNFEREYIEGEEVRYKKPPPEIRKDIYAATGGWPRLMDNVLFSPAREGVEGAIFFEKGNELFAWLEEQGRGVQWTGRELLVDDGGKVNSTSEAKMFNNLIQNTPPERRYRSVETLPHVPQREDLYYFERDLPEPTGKVLARFLDLFNPATKWDRFLIEAMILTGMWGGAPGKRPAFVITSDHGRGSGKTSTAQAIARVYGGVIGVKAGDGWDQLQQRLLDPSTASKRYTLIDNLKNRLSSAEFEAMITEPTINGKRMYVGDGERVNLLTWIFTANTPSLSNDLASRSVVIKVGQADHSVDFEAEVKDILDHHHDQLLSDIKARLEEPVSGQVTDHADRWQAWQRAVLTRFEEADELARIVQERRGEVDDDIAMSEEWNRATREILEKNGHNPDTIKTVIPSGQVVEIARKVEHDKTMGYKEAWDAYRNIQGCGAMKNTKKYTSTPRGMLWVGPDWDLDGEMTDFKTDKNNSPI